MRITGCREELKSQNLSFTSIAKLVGERWQALAARQKEPFETQATSLKDTYNTELAKYRRTSGYKDYVEYLADFKAKNANPSTGMESSMSCSLRESKSRTNTLTRNKTAKAWYARQHRKQ